MAALLSRSYKHKFPFRLGTTSFVYPSTWADNVENLAPYLDEIELLFFESTPGSLPDHREIQTLRGLAEAWGITYNVHLPLDLSLGSEAVHRRRFAVETVLMITALTEPLTPTTYTIHLDFNGDAGNNRQIASWQRRTAESLQAIVDGGLAPERLSVENLHYPFALAEPIVGQLGLAVCFDVGHLHLAGKDVMAAWERYRTKTRIVHLYGIGPKGEHRSLNTLPGHLAESFVRRLHRFHGSVSLEVFSFAHLAGSLDRLERLWQQTAGAD